MCLQLYFLLHSERGRRSYHLRKRETHTQEETETETKRDRDKERQRKMEKKTMAKDWKGKKKK